jgi:serine/threonine protein kinase
MIYQISLGLCFLNTKNVIHRDLKPQNIVINPSLVPHIIDFGSCCSSYGSNSFNSFDKRLLTTKAIHVAFHEIP